MKSGDGGERGVLGLQMGGVLGAGDQAGGDRRRWTFVLQDVELLIRAVGIGRALQRQDRGRWMLGSRAVMSKSRKRGSSQASFQPRNAVSTSRW